MAEISHKYRYEVVETLSNNKFSSTYLARKQNNPSHLYTIQCYSLNSVKSFNHKFLESQAKILTKLSKKKANIPLVIDYFTEEERFYLVQEYVTGENLLKRLPSTEIEIINLVKSVVKICQLLQNKKIFTKNIQPEQLIYSQQDGQLFLVNLELNFLETYCQNNLATFGKITLDCLKKIPEKINPQLTPIIDRLIIQQDNSDNFTSILQDLESLTNLSGIETNNQWQIIVSALFLTSVTLFTFNLNSNFVGNNFQAFSLNKENFSLIKGAEDWVNQGLAKAKKGDLQGAISDYNRAIQLDNNYAIAYYNRAIAFDNLGNKKSALQDYNRAIKIDSHYADAYNNRGSIFYALGKLDNAIKDYTKAIDLDSNYALAYYNRAVTYTDLGETKKAIADYHKAIQLQSQYTDAYFNRGLLYSDLGEHQKAIADYNRVIELRSEYIDAYLARGLVYADLGELTQAVENYTQALRINPQYALAYYNRAVAFAQLRNPQAAIKDYTLALEAKGDWGGKTPAEAYNNRGLMFWSLQDTWAAIEDFEQAIQLNPNYANAYYNLARALVFLDRKSAAIENFQKAAQLYQQQGQINDYQSTLKELQKLKG